MKGCRQVEVRNKTRGSLLAARAELAHNFWKLLMGLIPYPALGEGEGMVLPYTGSIHTCGVRFPIDVIFVDREGRVRGRRKGVGPFRIAWAPRGTRTTIELPAGVLDRFPCDPGDEIIVTEIQSAP